MGKVNPTDGNLSSYLATSELNLTGKATSMDSIYDFSGEVIEVLGNFTTSSCVNLNVWFIPFLNDLCYFGPSN